MKYFWKYIFPILFGLIIYVSIRLVNDSMTKEQFWDRSWQQNTIEIISVIFLSFIFDQLLRFFIKRFDEHKKIFSVKNVLQEFGKVCFFSIIIFNPGLYLIHYLIHQPVKLGDIMIGNFLVILYILLYYAIARSNTLLNSYIEQQTQMEKIKNEQLQTELKFLKAQYHPHFLFNALNTIYFQMDESVDEAKQTIEKFSDLLRYQLYDHNQLVFIHQEFDYLRNFIHLQKTRATGKLQLTLNIDEFLYSEKVYPLLFLPLAENAFKYLGGNYHLSIEAKKHEEQIIFKVENSLSSVQKEKGGIGLENLKRRLDLLYPGTHCFSAEVENDNFVALLKIPVL